ncbi:MAG: hypothetical protein IJL43_01000 [Lachnospiraceae bacterium]|nr:hypothetical protein [Lachnospiraceae bacterium]
MKKPKNRLFPAAGLLLLFLCLTVCSGSGRAASAASETKAGVDAAIRPQAEMTLMESGYETVTVSLHHANELRNGNDTVVYACINSHHEAFEEYLRSVRGFNAPGSTLRAYPDAFAAELSSEDVRLLPQVYYVDLRVDPHWSYSNALPGGSMTGSPLEISRTSVLTGRSLTSVAFFGSKDGNWGDGLEKKGDTPGGCWVSSAFLFAGNNDVNVPETLTVKAWLRYRVYYTYLGETTVLHIWTGDAEAAGKLTVLP